MRLFEVENTFVDDLSTLLRNRIGRAGNRSEVYTWQAFSNLIKNVVGTAGMTADQFQQIYDDNPEIQPYIKNFDKEKIELGTKAETDQEVGTAGDAKKPEGPSVDQMAQQGVAAHYQDLETKP